MPGTIPDLWPDEIKVEIASPLAILRRQASQLRIWTKDLLEAEVKTYFENGEATHEFRIVAAALDGYAFSLFTASHSKDLVYPVTISYKPWDDAVEAKRGRFQLQGEEIPSGARTANTPSEFLDLLKDILNSGHAKSVIVSLMARINE